MAEQMNQAAQAVASPETSATSTSPVAAASAHQTSSSSQKMHGIRAFWSGLSKVIQKIIIFGAIGLLLFSVALAVFLNANSSKYVALYPTMEVEESKEVYDLITELGFECKLDAGGQVQVLKEQQDYLIAQMAMKKYPKSTLPYDITDKSNGLTSTDYEKQLAYIQQAQNRLQDTLKMFTGVKNAIVTINSATKTNRVWEQDDVRSSASVSLFLEDEVTLSKEQVSGMKYLVSSSVQNMKPEDVKVIDGATSISLRSTEDGDPSGLDGVSQRMAFEERMERKLSEKALNIVTMFYPASDVRAEATVQFDYSKVLTETKKYEAAEGSENTGVLVHNDKQQTTNTSSAAQGIPGEEDNTDLPTPEYVDGLTGDQSNSNYAESNDFLVSQILEQIEKDPTQLKTATIAVTIKATPDTEPDQITLESLTDNISKATNIPAENVSLKCIVIEPPVEDTITQPEFVLTPMMMMVMGGALLLFLLILIVIILVRRSKRKKQLAMLVEAQEEAEIVADQNTEFNLQQEFEERKRQLRQSAATRTADDAITEEVREFARTNPEITANLLRAWMKEEID